ncbi:TPA: hypothetical protein ACHIF5_004738, partial [Escherichia coli]
VTDAVMEQVVEWQNRPLDAVYPIVYLEKIVLPYNNFPYPNSLLQDSGPGLRVVSGRAVAC